MPMKFKQIQAFITVAREGNMTLAAEKMGITQSGLSRLLLSLEADPYGIATLSVAQQQPSVTGTINIRQRIALPPDAVLTVTLSDASLADAPARVLSQKAVRTEGKQAPFNFALPYNPADIQPNARILLSAAITVNGQLMFITDTVQTVINQGGTHAELTLVPVQQTAVPVAQ